MGKRVIGYVAAVALIAAGFGYCALCGLFTSGLWGSTRFMGRIGDTDVHTERFKVDVEGLRPKDGTALASLLSKVLTDVGGCRFMECEAEDCKHDRGNGDLGAHSASGPYLLVRCLVVPGSPDPSFASTLRVDGIFVGDARDIRSERRLWQIEVPWNDDATTTDMQVDGMRRVEHSLAAVISGKSAKLLSGSESLSTGTR